MAAVEDGGGGAGGGGEGDLFGVEGEVFEVGAGGDEDGVAGGGGVDGGLDGGEVLGNAAGLLRGGGEGQGGGAEEDGRTAEAGKRTHQDPEGDPWTIASEDCGGNATSVGGVRGPRDGLRVAPLRGEERSAGGPWLRPGLTTKNFPAVAARCDGGSVARRWEIGACGGPVARRARVPDLALTAQAGRGTW